MSQTKSPWLSIITACYNDSKNLKKTIKSIINQDVDFAEYIIIDGDSSDDTVKVIEENNRFISTWISEKDDGVYDAMNKGLKLASGQYILFINAGAVSYTHLDVYKRQTVWR